MSSSNQSNQGSRFLADKPKNVVDAKEKIFRIDGKNNYKVNAVPFFWQLKF